MERANKLLLPFIDALLSVPENFPKLPKLDKLCDCCNSEVFADTSFLPLTNSPSVTKVLVAYANIFRNSGMDGQTGEVVRVWRWWFRRWRDIWEIVWGWVGVGGRSGCWVVWGRRERVEAIVDGMLVEGEVCYDRCDENDGGGSLRFSIVICGLFCQRGRRSWGGCCVGGVCVTD